MSSDSEKLAEFQRAWSDADDNYQSDLTAAAGNSALAHDIETDWWTHQSNWARAATAALDKTSPDIERAYVTAKDANDAVTDARVKAKGIVTIIQGSTKVATSLTGLLKAVV